VLPKAVWTASYLLSTNSTFIKRWETRSVFEITVVDQRDGILIFKVKGKNAKKCFDNESGGIQWQRVPPTEKKGRVQTSLITVAVLPEEEYKAVTIDENDLNWAFKRGSGPGGQHKNRTDSCVVLTHKPSGIVVTIDGRKQGQNKQEALKVLSQRLEEQSRNENKTQGRQERLSQIGPGFRGHNKIRTVRFKDGVVIDHRLGKTIPLKDYLRGNLSNLRT
jgi:peptide chain release factor 1